MSGHAKRVSRPKERARLISEQISGASIVIE